MDLLHALFRWICATISANFHFESHFQRKNTLWWMKSVQLAGKILKCVTLIRGGFKCTKCPSIQPVRKTLCRARGANCQTKKPISTFETGTRISVFQFLISRRKTRINIIHENAFLGRQTKCIAMSVFWNFTEWCKLQAAYMVKV